MIPYSWTVLCQDSSLKVLYIHSYTDLCNTKTGPLVAASKDVICTTTMRRGCHHETEGSVPWRNSASCTRRPRNRDSLISSPPPWPGSWPWGVAAIVPGQSARAAGRHPAHHHPSSRHTAHEEGPRPGSVAHVVAFAPRPVGQHDEICPKYS